MNQACLNHFGGASSSSAWYCFHGAIAAQFVSTVPLFILNSRFDTWQERGVLGLTTCKAVVTNGIVDLCPNMTNPTMQAEKKFWEIYGDSMTAALNAVPVRHAA